MDTKPPILFCAGYKHRPLLAVVLTVALLTGCVSAKPTPLATGSSAQGSLHVTLSGLRSDQGQVMVSLFASPDGFPDKVLKSLNTVTAAIHKQHAEVVLPNIPYGSYAVSVLHDEDNNGEMSTSMFGFPREGFCFSGHPDYKFGHPRFDQAQFYLVAPQQELTLVMRYQTGKKEHQERERAKKSKSTAS